VDQRKKFLIKRAIALVMFGLVLIQVGPSLADVLDSNPAPAPVTSPAPEESVSPSPSPAPSETAQPTGETTTSAQPTGTYTYLSVSESPTPEPTLADIQDVVLRTPAKFPVDPRATSVQVSPVNIYSSGDVLVCISTTGSHFWLTNQSPSVLTFGNGSRFLALSGTARDVNAVLNSGQGLRVGGNPRVQGSVVFSRAVSVTRPTLNLEFCGQATATAHSSVTALGLGMNTVKNPVPIK
jgi:hypothetical protein